MHSRLKELQLASSEVGESMDILKELWLSIGREEESMATVVGKRSTARSCRAV